MSEGKPRIYLSRAQVEKAFHDFQNALPGQSGFYAFTEYSSEYDQLKIDLRRIVEENAELKQEIELLRTAENEEP